MSYTSKETRWIKKCGSVHSKAQNSLKVAHNDVLLTKYVLKWCDSLGFGQNQRGQSVILVNSMCHGNISKEICLLFMILFLTYC